MDMIAIAAHYLIEFMIGISVLIALCSAGTAAGISFAIIFVTIYASVLIFPLTIMALGHAKGIPGSEIFAVVWHNPQWFIAKVLLMFWCLAIILLLVTFLVGFLMPRRLRGGKGRLQFAIGAMKMKWFSKTLRWFNES